MIFFLNIHGVEVIFCLMGGVGSLIQESVSHAQHFIQYFEREICYVTSSLTFFSNRQQMLV